MKQNKSKFRLRITDVHLHAVMLIDTSEMEPDVNSLTKKKRVQVPQ